MKVSHIVLVPALLFAGALSVSAYPASDTATPSPSGVLDPAPAAAQGQDGDVGLEARLLARQLMKRIEEHRSRLARLEKVTQYYRKQGDLRKIQEMEHLRHRETEAYQQTLADYRRVLGNQSFDRVARAVRYYIRNDGLPGDSASGPERTRDLARRVDNYRDQTQNGQPLRTRDLARRVDNYRSKNGEDQGAREASASVNRSLERQLDVERARASERMALAQRLQKARAQQLRLMAEQQRRYRPSGPTGQGAGAGRPAGAQGGNAGRPTVAPPAPTNRRRPR